MTEYAFEYAASSSRSQAQTGLRFVRLSLTRNAIGLHPLPPHVLLGDTSEDMYGSSGAEMKISDARDLGNETQSALLHRACHQSRRLHAVPDYISQPI